MIVLWIDKTEIEEKALKIRQENKIQTYGIKDIFSLIEQMDIHLIRYPFGRDTVLGFSTIFEGKEVIVSNSSEIFSREIFTIAHELGHVVYDFEDNNQDVKIDINVDDIDENISEARAFHFANCLLISLICNSSSLICPELSCFPLKSIKFLSSCLKSLNLN